MLILKLEYDAGMWSKEDSIRARKRQVSLKLELRVLLKECTRRRMVL